MRRYRRLFPCLTNSGRRSRRFPWPFGAGLLHHPAGWTVTSIWRLSKPSTCLRRPALPRMSKLFLRLEQMGVVMKEFFYLVLHTQDLGPLFLIERDRKPADSVQR